VLAGRAVTWNWSRLIVVGANLCLQWSGGIQSARGCAGTGSRSWTEDGQRVATEPDRAWRRGYLVVMS
jgi:hypothetical protein